MYTHASEKCSGASDLRAGSRSVGCISYIAATMMAFCITASLAFAQTPEKPTKALELEIKKLQLQLQLLKTKNEELEKQQEIEKKTEPEPIRKEFWIKEQSKIFSEPLK